MDEPELNPHERALLRRAVSQDVPPGFADAVIDAFTEDDAQPASATATGRSRWHWAVAGGAVALAAALVVLVTASLVGTGEQGARQGTMALQQTFEILEEHCGACHDAERSGAPRGALASFDLDDPKWPARMSDERLRALADRVDSQPDVTKAQRNRIRSFVQAELGSRRG